MNEVVCWRGLTFTVGRWLSLAIGEKARVRGSTFDIRGLVLNLLVLRLASCVF